MKEVQRITGAKTASALANARQRFLVLRLAGRELSLQDLSELSGMSLSLLHYHIARLQKLGLVEVAKYEPRSGRSIKYYRATAQAFFVPAHLAPSTGKNDLMAALRAGLERSRRDGDGVLYSTDEHGAPRMQIVQGKSKVPSAESWLVLHLSRANAQALSDELRSLLARYRERGSGREPHYLIHCALAPVASNHLPMRTGHGRVSRGT
jgi:DNA-binding transcriptional ArsR family regulator